MVANLSDLPYGGNVQEAQAAGDRDAIRAIFNQRLDAEDPSRVAPQIVVISEEDSTIVTAEEDFANEHQNRRRARRLLCILLIMPLLFMFLIVTSQAAQQRTHAEMARHHHAPPRSNSAYGRAYSLHNYTGSYGGVLAPRSWFITEDGNIAYRPASTTHQSGGGHVHRTPGQDAESWWYFVGFSCLIMGVGHGKGALFYMGGAIMLATAARASYVEDHSATSALFFGVLALMSVWVAAKIGCVSPARERREQEEETTRAIDQGLKTIIYRSGRCKAAVGRRRSTEYSTIDGKGEEEECAVDLECGKCAVQGGEEEEEEAEECPICLEAFRDGDELAASGCGHYFHKECVGQWVQA